jgi:lysophospholipase L1-like esterase
LIALPVCAQTAAKKPKKPAPAAAHKAASKTAATKTRHGAAKPSRKTTHPAANPRARSARTVHPPAHSYAVTRVPLSEYPAGPVEPTGNPFLYPQNLNPFFQALEAYDQHLPTAPETIRILQFGDSHTAADIFTGAVRAALQAHFGDGGLGFQYPGHPFAGYHLAGSSRSQTSGWYTEGNHFLSLGDGDLGLGGISIATSRPGESISLGTTCTTFQLEYLRQPQGGRLSFTDNGIPISEIDTASPPNDPSSGAGTFTYACTPGEHAFTLTTLDRAPVRLLGLVTEQPGVTYECLGINGAVAPLMLRWNQQIFADYLRQRDPNLIVLAYGTNEAAQSATYNEDYLQKFTQLIDNLHTYAPQAAILVLGPYDRATRIGRGRHALWSTWYGTQRIIADQEQVCRTHHCTFYNEQSRMGGPGSMIHWAAAGLAQPDRTHLTGTGYRELAQALYADLLNAYQSYQQTPLTP